MLEKTDSGHIKGKCHFCLYIKKWVGGYKLAILDYELSPNTVIFMMTLYIMNDLGVLLPWWTHSLMAL